MERGGGPLIIFFNCIYVLFIFREGAPTMTSKFFREGVVIGVIWGKVWGDKKRSNEILIFSPKQGRLINAGAIFISRGQKKKRGMEALGERDIVNNFLFVNPRITLSWTIKKEGLTPH